jgi:hypothetical protein
MARGMNRFAQNDDEDFTVDKTFNMPTGMNQGEMVPRNAAMQENRTPVQYENSGMTGLGKSKLQAFLGNAAYAMSPKSFGGRLGKASAEAADKEIDVAQRTGESMRKEAVSRDMWNMEREDKQAESKQRSLERAADRAEQGMIHTFNDKGDMVVADKFGNIVKTVPGVGKTSESAEDRKQFREETAADRKAAREESAAYRKEALEDKKAYNQQMLDLRKQGGMEAKAPSQSTSWKRLSDIAKARAEFGKTGTVTEGIIAMNPALAPYLGKKMDQGMVNKLNEALDREELYHKENVYGKTGMPGAVTSEEPKQKSWKDY